MKPDDTRHNRRNAPTRYATDWDAYDRVQWQREDTLDPEARLAVQPRICRALGNKTRSGGLREHRA